MSTIINADTSNGLKLTSDTSGIIQLQSGGTTKATVNSSGLTSPGHVIQVVNKVISTQGSQSVGTTDTQVGTGTDFDLSITPKGAGSKFVVSARWFGEVNNAWNVVFNIQRDGVRINTDGATASNILGLTIPSHSYSAATTNDDSTPEIMHLQTIDSTGSTAGSAITYTLVASTQTNRTMWTNRTFTTGASRELGVSELAIMEVAQ